MATQYGTINPIEEIILNKSGAESWLVHGSLFYNGYIYGVPRVSPNTVAGHNAICKVKASDYSDYNAVCMKDSFGVDLYYGEQIVACGGYLYAALFSPNNNGILRIDPDTLAHTLIYPYGADGLDSDGTYLYFMSGGSVGKLDPTTMIITWLSIPSASFNDNDNGGIGEAAYSVLVDETHIYLNCLVAYSPYPSPGYLVAKSRIHKILKSDMSYVGYATVAQVTDDMGQNDDYIFCGHEPGGADCYGYTWGASAVRKSDLEVFCLPKLGSSDTAGNLSYSSLRFGSYLIDCKYNNHLYVIDITDPSSWTIGTNPDDVVLFDYTVTGDTFPHNEILMDNVGKFHEFVWGAGCAASLKRIMITGLGFTSSPELVTVGATDITASFATMNGYIRASGGREITDNGFVIGTSSGTYGSPISVPAVPAGSFSLLIESLTPGQTYYYKSYASNSIGTTYSAESSFTVHSSATVPSILGTVTEDSVAVQGATVFLVNVGSGQFVGKKLSNAAGRYAFTGLLTTSKYHAATEYAEQVESYLLEWNTKSYPYLVPVLE